MCFAQGTVPELPMKASSATSNVALSARSVIADPGSKGFLVTGCMKWREGLQNVVRTWTELSCYYQYCSREKQPWWRSGGLSGQILNASKDREFFVKIDIKIQFYDDS